MFFSCVTTQRLLSQLSSPDRGLVLVWQVLPLTSFQPIFCLLSWFLTILLHLFSCLSFFLLPSFLSFSLSLSLSFIRSIPILTHHMKCFQKPDKAAGKGVAIHCLCECQIAQHLKPEVWQT